MQSLYIRKWSVLLEVLLRRQLAETGLSHGCRIGVLEVGRNRSGEKKNLIYIYIERVPHTILGPASFFMAHLLSPESLNSSY